MNPTLALTISFFAIKAVPASDGTQTMLASLRGAIAVFKIRSDRWPRTLTELAEARVIDRVPTDGWGRAFLWLRPIDDQGPGCLLSTGPDGQAGTEDDLGAGCDRAVLNQHLLMRAGLAHERSRDAYGNAILLLNKGDGTLAWSYGPDGKPDTADDQMARIGARGEE